MKVCDYGKVEIHADYAPQSNLYKLSITKGNLPVALQGLYSTMRDAKLAVMAFQGQNRNLIEEKLSPSQAKKVKDARAS